jgi:hypothetical protein
MKNKLDADRHYDREDKAWLNEVLDDVGKKLERDSELQRHKNVYMPKYHSQQHR